MLLSSELQLTLTLEQVLSQTILTPLTAHSKNQLTTERNTSFQTAPSCCLFIHPHLFPHLTHTYTQTNTHTQTYKHTHSCCVHSLSSMLKNIFFCSILRTLRTCVQSILPVAYNSFHLFSCVRLYETKWTAAQQDSLSITNSQSLLNLKSIESPMPSNISATLIPLSLAFIPS